jgi:hypothetical protein
VGVAVGVVVGVAVGVPVGVVVGVMVGVIVGVSLGVSVGVLLGVAVGVTVGVFVGVLVGVCDGVGPLSEPTTSPADDPFLFHVARIWEPCPEARYDDTDKGASDELTVVGVDHVVYGLIASEYFTVPLSTNHATKFELDEYKPDPREVASPLNTDIAVLHDPG